MDIKQLKREFREYLKQIWPDVYEGDYLFHRDYEKEQWRWFLIKINQLGVKK